MPKTLVDCGCETKVHRDGSGVEVYYCDLHGAADELSATLSLICAEAESWHSMHHAQNLIQCDSICALIPRMRAALRKAGRLMP